MKQLTSKFPLAMALVVLALTMATSMRADDCPPCICPPIEFDPMGMPNGPGPGGLW